jgi:hypothetical protein
MKDPWFKLLRNPIPLLMHRSMIHKSIKHESISLQTKTAKQKQIQSNGSHKYVAFCIVTDAIVYGKKKRRMVFEWQEED